VLEDDEAASLWVAEEGDAVGEDYGAAFCVWEGENGDEGGRSFDGAWI